VRLLTLPSIPLKKITKTLFSFKMMTQITSILTWVLITLSLLPRLRGQTLAQDLAVVKLIFEKFQGFSFGSKSSTIPKCNHGSNGFSVACSSTRVTGIDVKIFTYRNPIPSEIGNLTGLTSLSLMSNYDSEWEVTPLSGPIPSSLGRLTALTTLTLNGNKLSGSIPSSLGQLTSLTTLSLNDNQLSGNIPSSLGQLTKLTTLKLNHNQLNGSIPASFGQLTSLTSLSLQFNQLSDPIPSSFTRLVALKSLLLNNNKIVSVPSELTQLTSLTTLDLSNNQISSVPYELANFNDVITLKLTGNPFTTKLCILRQSDPQPDCPVVVSNYESLGGSARIPLHAQMKCCGWNNVQCEAFNREGCWNAVKNRIDGLWQTFRVTEINWEHQNLRGALSPSISNLTELNSLVLRDNGITGSLPTVLGQMVNLDQIDLGNNRISGRIPTEIGNLQNLARLSLTENLFSGAIPSQIGKLTALKSLELGRNQFTGSIPITLQDLST